MMKSKLINTAALIAALAPCAARGQIATSENFALEKAVVANGGGASAGTTFSVSGTAGQSAAGETSGPTFRLQGGFWSAIAAPTAANVSIEGRIFTPDGRGLRNAVVYLTGASGATRSTRSSTFGYYRFDEIEAGQIVIVAVNAKLYRFAPRALSIGENLSGVDFTALETK